MDTRSRVPRWIARLLADGGRYGVIGGLSEIDSSHLALPSSPPVFRQAGESKEEGSSASLTTSEQPLEGLGQGFAAAAQPAPQAGAVPSIRDFELLSVIGKGGFGKVYQVRHKKDEQVRWQSSI